MARMVVGLDEFFGLGIETDIDDLKACAFTQHAYQVLPDVVQVAFDRAHHDLAEHFGAALSQQRTQDLHPGCHRIGGHQHFGNKHIATFEARTDFVHANDQAVVENLFRGQALLQSSFNQFIRLVCIAFQHSG